MVGERGGTHGRGGWRGSRTFSVLTLPEIASGGRGPPETSRAAPGCACQGYQAQAALLFYPHLGQKILLSHPLASAGGPTTLHGFASEGRESAGPAPSRTGDRQTSLSVLLQRRLCCLPQLQHPVFGQHCLGCCWGMPQGAGAGTEGTAASTVPGTGAAPSSPCSISTALPHGGRTLGHHLNADLGVADSYGGTRQRRRQRGDFSLELQRRVLKPEGACHRCWLIRRAVPARQSRPLGARLSL